MIRITDLEQKLLAEQIFGESCGDLYKPDSFSEWESYESQKQEVYETLWNCEQMFWDIYEMAQRGVFSEAAPTAFSDTGTKDVPSVARKQVTISKQMAYQGLPQVPPSAAAGFLANNMVSSNPDYYRYIGKGFFGALQDRHQGKQPSNWVKEIRYVLQGKPAVTVIDRETGKPIPRMGAVTNRPIKEGEAQVPPAWNDYAPRKANAFQDEGGQPYHGVYIGYQDHIKQLETKIGQPIQMTPERPQKYGPNTEPQPIYKTVMGPDGKPTKSKEVMGYTKGVSDPRRRGIGMGRGEVEADLSPPVGRDVDPTGSSYLGSAGNPLTGEPAIPPGARGYKPQGLNSSNALQRQWGQYKYYMMKNPQLFDQRLIRVLMAKQLKDRRNAAKAARLGKPYTARYTPETGGEIPLEKLPFQTTTARTAPIDPDKPAFGQARDYRSVNVPAPTEKNPNKTKDVVQDFSRGYYRPMWHPDPQMPARRILSGPDKTDMSDDELVGTLDSLSKRIRVLKKTLANLKTMGKEIQSQHSANGTDIEEDSKAKEIRQKYVAAQSELQSVQHMFDSYSKGGRIVPKQVKTGRFGNERTAFSPEEEEEIRKKGTLNGTPISAKSRDRFVKRGKLVRDEKGNLIQMPTTGAIRKTVLPNNYVLTPKPGNPIVVSDKLRQLAVQKAQTSNKAQIAEIQQQIMAAAQSGNIDDKVYAHYAEKYGLEIDAKGEIRSSNSKMVGNNKTQTPWTWAETDPEGNVLFIYDKDSREYNIPMYLPGVIDTRKPGNPTAAGGWDAAPSNAPEIRPQRDPEREQRAIHGWTNPTTGVKQEGWKTDMIAAADAGVRNGISKLLNEKFAKSPDQFGNSGKDHYMYKALVEAKNELSNSAYMYFQYNLANSKALDFQQNHTGRLDFQYIKKTFPHLFAACKQFDQWLDQKDDGETPNRSLVKMRPGSSIFDLTFPQIMVVMNQLDEKTKMGEGTWRRLYQTKIRNNYVKNGLTNYKATDYLKPALKDPTGRTQPGPAPKDQESYTSSGKKVSYNYININYQSLMDLFTEARRNYWEFAAKDMVIKMWQHMNSQGSNVAGLYGDSLDAALGSGSGKRRRGKGAADQDLDAGDIGGDAGEGDPEGQEGGEGPTRSRLDGSGAPAAGKGHQTTGRMTPAELWRLAHEKLAKINAIKEDLVNHDHNGGIDNASEQLALVPASTRTSIQIDVMAELQEEAQKNGWNLDDKKVSDWFMSELEKRSNQKIKDENIKGRKLRDQQAKAEPEPAADLSPEDYLSKVKEMGLDPHKMWSDYAGRLLSNANMSDLEPVIDDLNSQIDKIPDRESKVRAEKTVSYHIVKDIMNRAGSISPVEKRTLMNMAKFISTNYRSLFDVGEYVPKALANVPDAPAQAPAKPKGGNGLGGRLGRKTA